MRFVGQLGLPLHILIVAPKSQAGYRTSSDVSSPLSFPEKYHFLCVYFVCIPLRVRFCVLFCKANFSFSKKKSSAQFAYPLTAPFRITFNHGRSELFLYITTIYMLSCLICCHRLVTPASSSSQVRFRKSY